MASYDIDENAISLDALQERLQKTDLIPSQKALLDGLAKKMAAIGKAGVASMADLRRSLKTPKSLTALSECTGVDASYLRLLKRTVNGFVPKPRPLKEMDWLAPDVVKRLDKAGIKNTRHFFETAHDGSAELAQKTGLDEDVIRKLLSISDLCRIQWVNPNFARTLVAAGAFDTAAVAAANPETLYEVIKRVNANAEFYKGTVGLRDIKRLVVAACYVLDKQFAGNPF